MQLSEFNGIRIEIRRKIKEIFGNRIGSLETIDIVEQAKLMINRWNTFSWSLLGSNNRSSYRWCCRWTGKYEPRRFFP